MISDPLRVLMVEDSEDDALLVLRQIRNAGRGVSHIRVDTPEAMARALDTEPWDIVIADYSMPHFNGLAALDLASKHDPDLPFILVSGAIGEETAVQAMKAGAHDYIMKGNLTRLVPAIERELADAENRRARRAAEASLRQSEEMYRTLVETSPDGIALLSPDGRVLVANQRMADMHGLSGTAEMIDTEYYRLTAHDGELAVRNFLQEILSGSSRAMGDFWLRKSDGTNFPAEIHASLVRDSLQRPRGVLVVERDTTERKAAEDELRANEERYRDLFDHASDIVYVHDLAGRFTAMNEAGHLLTGYSKADIAEMTIWQLVAPEYEQLTSSTIDLVLARPESRRLEVEFITNDGRKLSVELSAQALRRDGRPVAVQAIARDITERRMHMRLLEHHVLHDEATGLPNETLFRDRLDQTLALAHAQKKSGALLHIGIVGLDEVSASYGRHAEDQLIGYLAARIQGIIRATDTIARLERDVLGILLPECDVKHSMKTLQRITDICRQPVDVGVDRLRMEITSGIAVFPQRGDDVDTLMRAVTSADYNMRRENSHNHILIEHG